MIRITSAITIAESELQFDFVRASGPGGQNVNKVSTAVQLRFDARNSPSLSAEVRNRLIKLAGSRATHEGVIVIDARSTRSQVRNREEAVRRLIDLIARAAHRPRARIETRPSIASQRERVESKRARGETKRARRSVDVND